MKLEQVIATRPQKTVYRDGNRAVKVFAENYGKADILNEALNTARVEETGLRIPAIQEVCKMDGQWAIVTDFIEGQTLQALMDAHPEKFNEYLEKFVDIQLEIHSKTCPMLTGLTEKMQKKISQTTLDATCRYELHTRLDSMPKHHKLCHGDFDPSNVIITESGEAYVLDWAHATQGNASADAARTYLLFSLSGNISGAEKYMDLFCRKSDTAKQYVQKWIPIVAASQSVKGNPAETDLLLRWANVVDYE